MTWYEYLAVFALLYPGAMAVYWTAAGFFYFLFRENRAEDFEHTFREETPMVSILVYCRNQAANLDITVPPLLHLTYPNYELIFINDGSTDNTLDIIRRWAMQAEQIVLVDQPGSSKAAAMNNGIRHALGKYIIGIDGSTIINYSAVEYMVQSMEKRPELGAVTGSLRLYGRNPSHRRQHTADSGPAAESFKRPQSMIGTLFTLPGIMCVRKDVLVKIGGWSSNAADDIDIDWKTRIAGYRTAYEPRALCWALLPHVAGGFFRRKLHRAQGGAETILKYFRGIWKWHNARLWPLYAEYFTTLFWAHALTAAACAGLAAALHGGTYNLTLFQAACLATFILFVFQTAASILTGSRRTCSAPCCFFRGIGYLYAFWLLNGILLIYGFFKALSAKPYQTAWFDSDGEDNGFPL